MQADFRKAFANGPERSEVVFMCVSNENVPQLKLVFGKNVENRLCLPTGIKQRGFTRDFVPRQVTVHGNAVGGRGKAAQFAPKGQVLLRRRPPVVEPFQLRWMQTDQLRKGAEVRCFCE